jgi:Fe2+ transport system protein FeoA
MKKQLARQKPACDAGPINLSCHPVNKRVPPCKVIEGQCAGPAVCPLTRVAAGTTVCIKELAASPELRDRLRELGLGEEQRIKLLSSNANVICQVCNARLALSEKLARAILVEPVPAKA